MCQVEAEVRDLVEKAADVHLTGSRLSASVPSQTMTRVPPGRFRQVQPGGPESGASRRAAGPKPISFSEVSFSLSPSLLPLGASSPSDSTCQNSDQLNLS